MSAGSDLGPLFGGDGFNPTDGAEGAWGSELGPLLEGDGFYTTEGAS